MICSADPSSENPVMSWEFFVNHYSDQDEATRDDKFTWRLPNGDYHIGSTAPEGAEPLGIYYPRTGTLGGCGNHNAMNLALPPDADWDIIANLTGDDSWRPDRMRAYYEQIEHSDYVAAGTPGHGFDGWLHSNQNDLDLWAEDENFAGLLQSAANVTEGEQPTIQGTFDLLRRDMNRNDIRRYEQPGIFTLPLHTDARSRRSSAQTYITETIAERNADGSQRYPLTVSTSSLATRIIFSNSTDSSSNPRAVGVDYLYGQGLYKADRRYDGTQQGVPRTVMANREVIVAGGVFNTPQLLKLSGVGPRDELEQFGIPVVKELPTVGTNLMDNYEGGVEAEASTDFINPFENCTNLAPGDPCLESWQRDGSGPYSIGAAPAAILARSSVSQNNDTDLFFFGAAASIFNGYFPGFSRVQAPATQWWWSIVKMQPRNHAGTVKLRSANPQDTPLIDFNYFQEGGDEDLQALAEGVELSRRIFEGTNSSITSFNLTVPGPPYANVTDSLRYQTWGHHACGTCPIGVDTNTSCVDSNFRVHGIDGLRVVDGSVFPEVPGAFPILPTFLIGAKAADVINNAA